MFGYEKEIVSLNNLKLDEKNHYKIGYVDGNTICISEDCYKYIHDSYETDAAKILVEGLCLLLLEVHTCNIDTDVSIERIGIIINDAKYHILPNTFKNLIEQLIKVCDTREYHIPKEYF